MIKHGGLLTEYMTHTQPVARNFVQRNRIVAGCSDATILIESAAKGGGLITCSIARAMDVRSSLSQVLLGLNTVRDAII